MKVATSCFKTSEAPQGRTISALGNAQGPGVEESTPKPCKGEQWGFLRPFRAGPEKGLALLTQAVGLGWGTPPFQG